MTVTGVDDDIIDGTQNSNLTLSIVSAITDDDFDAVADQTVSVSTTDDDVAGFTVSEPDGSTTVTEAGDTDTFTVVLDAQPDSDVVLSITSSDTGEATVTSTLTFTSANWDTAQVVTVTGVDDDLIDGTITSTTTISVDDANSDDNFDAVADQTVSVSTTDDDVAGFTVSEPDGSTTVTEAGDTDTFTVVLDAQPDSDVVLSITSSDTGEATVTSTLTFTSANWDTAQVVTVTGVDDDLVDGTETSTMTISIVDEASDNNFDAVADQTVSVSTTDDDVAGFTVSEPDGSTTVTEAGDTDTFTVVLNAQPDANVILSIISGDTGEATVTSSLTFTSANWDTAQVVTVTGVDDDLVDGTEISTITISIVDVASDDNFDAVADQTVSVSTTDDDVAGFTVSEPDGSTSVTEAGDTDTFTVVLNAQPDSDVVLSITSSDTGEATANSPLTFTSANWDTAQVVTVTGVDDDLIDGTISSNLLIAIVDASSDDDFDAVADQTVSVSTTDDDVAGFTVSEPDGSTTVTEAGDTDTFTVVLNAQPSSNVVLSISSSDTGEATVTSSLTFTSANWDTAQVVTVTGVDDDLIDGTITSTTTISVDDANSDDNFDAVADQTVSVSTTDDDVAGFTVSEPDGSTTVTEAGDTDTFTVVLDAQPSSNVVLSISSSDTGEATVTSTVTFTSANWDTAQVVTVTGVDDDLVDGTITSTVTVSVIDAASDNNFDAVADQTVSVSTTDDDVAGFTVSEPDGSTTVTEAGDTDTFTVVLDAQPDSDVVLSITSSDTGEATVTSSLTFTSANWDTAQVVTVTGVDDNIIDGTITSTVTVSVNDAASDNNFDAVADQTVSVSTTDDDVAGFTIDQLDGSTEVDESADTDTFTVVLNAQPNSDVVLSITSSDTGEATVTSTVTFTSANWDTAQVVTVTGVDDDIIDGTVNSTITVTIVDAISDDDFDDVADQTVSVSTTDDDVAGFTITETESGTEVNESSTTDTFKVVLNAQPTTDVQISVTSADTGEVTASPATLTFTPANWDIVQIVTVTGINDSVDDESQITAVTLSIVDANSDDDFDDVADQIVSVTTTDNDTAGFTVIQSGGSTGVNEDGETDSFTVVLNSEPISDVVIAISSDDTDESTVSPGSLTFTSENWDTSQSVIVTGADDDLADGTQNSTVTISVVDLSSDDSFDSLADQSFTVTTADNDIAGFTIAETNGSTEVDESGDTDIFTVVLDAQPANDVVLSISSSDTGEATVTNSLTFTSANWDTAQTVTVTGVDDSLLDGSQSSIVTISVVDQNTSDEFDAVADQTVSVSTTDDDVAGFTIVEFEGSTEVNESGDTDTFTVVLDAQPDSNVVVAISVSDSSETSVNSPLTFTSANWDTAQVVTVTGVDDDIIDGTINSTITVTIVDAISDDQFDAVADQTVSVSTTDDDVAGFTVSETEGSTGVDESGTTDIITVVLNAQPASDVVITVTSSDTGEATVTSSLTFTSENWDTPQNVTVTGVDDDLVDGTVNSTVTIAVDDANSDDDFDAVADQAVTASTTDDDVAGFTVTETEGSTGVTEAGSTDILNVVLNSQPDSDVVLTISSSDTGESSVHGSTVSNNTITFTSANWDTPQAFTVTGVDDDLVDGTVTSTVTISVVDAVSDDNFDAVADQTVSVSTTDDDVAGFTIVELDGSTEVDESGDTDTFTVVLDAQPDSDVVLTITSSDTGEATVTSSLTFTSANWDTAQVVTVTGVDDDLIDGTIASTVTVSVNDAASDNNFDAVADQTVSVSTTDDDVAGFTIDQLDGSIEVDESGDTDTFTVVLDAQPTSDVVITITSSDTGEATVTSTLTFTPANWDTPQVATITGEDDDIIDGSQTSTITVSIDDANSDDDFDAIADQTVSVSTTDDDVAGFTVSETEGSTGVDESGTTDIITVVLNAQPASDVVITVTSSDTGEATVTSSLTFTSENWDTPQNVTVTGVDDDLVDGTVNSTVTIAVDDANSDDDFDAVADQAVTASTTDDDVAGFTIDQLDGSIEVDESGDTDTFTVVLNAQPDSDVVLSITSSDTGEATVTSPLTFTSANWDTAQVVTVTGVDDDLIDGTITSTVTVSVVDASSDNNFDAVADQTVSVSTTDDDVVGFTIDQLDGSIEVDESGDTDTFTVVLDAQPDSDVVLTITSSDTGEATVTSSLTFTSANWDTAQVVTVTGVDDDLIDGTIASTVTVSVNDAASDNNFDAVADQTVSVSTTDDDVAGFTIDQLDGSTEVDESGDTDTFTVVLNAQPTSDVLITLETSDAGEATVTSSLTFTSANWDTAQVVTVTGVDDDIIDGTINSTITASIVDAASDDDFDAVADQTVTASTTDDDVAGFTIDQLDGSIEVDESGDTDTFTVVLDAQPTSDVVITITSSDTGEATVTSTLTFTPANWDTPQVATITGEDDDIIDGSQTSTITVSIDDANSDDDFDAIADQTVSVSTTDDDVAGFTVSETQGSTGVDESGTTDIITVVLNAQPASDVVMAISSSDASETAVNGSTANNNSLTFTSANWDTPQSFTVTGVDDDLVDGTVNSTLTISVVDALSDNGFDAVADQTVTASTTDDDVAGFTIDQLDGSIEVDESGDTDTFTVVLDAQPTSDVVITITSSDTGEATVTSTLTFTPANWDTPQVATITGEDDDIIDGSQTSTITVSIDDANSDDDFDAIADQTVSVSTTDDDVAGFTVSETQGSTGVDESGTTDIITVVLNAQPASNVVMAISSSDISESSLNSPLTFTPANWDTAQTVTITGVDDDVIDGDQATTITISVVDALSDDDFDSLNDQTVASVTTDNDQAGFTVVEFGGSTGVTESGDTDTFTVVLDAQPDSDVVLTITSSDTGEATVTSTLTFTSANWNTAQTVTVTGVDDNAIDGSQTSTITIAVDDANSDNNFDAVADKTVTVVTTDDDNAGFTIVQTQGTTSVAESGTTDLFTVVLDTQPTSDVVITLTSNDTGEATVTSTLTFTSANWDTEQTVTVTGVDDAAVDGNQVTTITVAIDDANSDDGYDAVENQTVSVTTTDDDTAGYTIQEDDGSTEVDESGTTDTFTVVLNTQPLSDVVFSIISSDTGEATVTSSLTFTPANWDTPQTATVTGIDDDIVDGTQSPVITISVNDALSHDDFDDLQDQTINASNTDDDVAGFTINELNGSVEVTEAGGTDTFTVVLDAQPTSNVVLTLTSNDIGESSVSSPITFTAANWDTPQTVTVTGIDDDIIDGEQGSSITISIDDANSDNDFDSIPDQTVSVLTADDDVAGFTVDQLDGSVEVTEAGGTDTFTVVLDAQPTSDVVIALTSSDTGEATISGSLTFTSANWDTPQTVTVTGVDDNLIDGTITSNISVSIIDAISDANFQAVNDQTVSVSTTDDDVAGFTVDQLDGSVEVTEAGGTDTFTVVLDAQPTSDVVITVVSSDTGEATVNSPLTFTSANWDTPQTVTITGIDDDLVDGTITSTITLAVDDANADDSFDAVADQTVSATTTDDDVAGFTVDQLDGSVEVDESGTTDTFTVVLDAQPTSDVVIALTSSDTGEATISGSLTFTPANWDTPQTVTVTGVDDNLIDGTIASSIAVTIVDAISDNDFDSIPDQTVSVSTTDDDVAGFTVDQLDGSVEVTEAGGTDTFTVVLDAQPTSDVVITVVSSDTGEATVNSPLTFTSANWDTPQTVTITGIDDDLVDGTITSTITLAVDDANADDSFDAVADQTVSATTTDDDVAGFTVDQLDGSVEVDESGTTDTFTVVLDAQPTSDVVIALTSSDTGEATISGSLTFTPANWDTPQTVTVTGVDDLTVDGTQTESITVTVIDEISDNDFDAVADQTVSVAITDDDVAGFTVDQLDGSVEVDESGTTDTFTVVLDAQPTSDVVIALTSSDTGEATVNSPLTFTSANWDTPQTVTVTGADDGSVVDGDQTSLITISIEDANSNDSFDAVVDQTVSATTTDDDVAGFTVDQLDGSVEVDESGTTDTFTVVLDAQPTSDVLLSLSINDNSEASVSSSLTFTPINWDSPQTVTVTGLDEETVDGIQTSTVTISVVDAVSNDSFDDVADQTVSVSTTDDDVAGFTVVEFGGSTEVDESGTTDIFTVVLDAQPTSDVVLTVTSSDTGEATVNSPLTFTPANWDTAQTVTVTGVDDDLVDGTITSTITLAVDDANADDSFDAVADQTVSVDTTDDDVAGFTVDEFEGSTEVDESGTTDTFTVVLDAQPTSDVVLTVTSSDTGEATVNSPLTFTPANWDTAQTVTVTGVDDDLVDGTITSTITIAVEDANSDDDFDAVADRTVSVSTTDDDVAGFTVDEFEGSTEVDESGTTDTFTVVLDAQPTSDVVLTVTSSDTGEATVNSPLTFTPANWDTAQTVTVTGVDDDLVDGTITSTITIAVEDANSDDDFDAVADRTVSVSTTDDDVAGFTVDQLDGSTEVTEAGSTDTFTVVLDAQPTSDVVVSIGSDDASESTTTGTLTFTPINWDTAQTVTVTGVDDNLIDGTQVSTITISVIDAISDNNFDAVADQTVSVSTTDDDVAGFTIEETNGSTAVDESGTTDLFTVVLDAQPTSNVVITLSSNDGSEISIPSSLTFTSANWDTAQTVTVTGVDDSIIDGTITSTITVAVDDANSDNDFDAVANQTVSVDTTDDDVAGFTVDEFEGSTEVDESGTTDTFTIVLDAQPASDVVISLTTDDTGEATVTSTLSFTAATWDTPQTVTVTGVDDNLIDGTQVSTITISVIDAISDNNFDAVADQTVSVDTTDDDVAGFTVDEFEGSTEVTEAGSTDTFTVVLDAQPTSDVVLTVTSSDTGEATVNSPLTFTPANWDTAQTVTVTGADDDLIDGTITSTITVAVDDANSDDDFDAVADRAVSVSTTDDDVAGFTIDELDGSLAVDESGTTDTFTVVLDAQPTSDVVITVTPNDTSEISTSGTLTFTPINWDTPQTVTVTGVDEDIVDGTITSAITLAVVDATSNDNFDAVADQTVSVDTTDDDVAGFTIDELDGSLAVDESGTTDTFTVVLDAQPTSDVVLTVTSDDTSETTVNSPLTFTPANWDTPQTVTVTGVDDSIIDGTITSTITVAVDDANSDNDFDAVADQTVSVDTTDDDVAGFTVDEFEGSTEVDESGTTDTFTIVLDAQPSDNVVIAMSSSDTGEATISGTISFTPANWDTPQTVTVTGADEDIIDGDQNSTITITIVDSISDSDFSNVADQTVSVVTTDDDVAGFTIEETEGSTEVDESGTTDIFTVVLDAQPTSDVVLTITSDDTGEATVNSPLTFTPANWDTAQTVTVTGADEDIVDGTITSTITVAVDDANSDDDFDAVADQTVSVDTTDDDVAGFTIDELDGSLAVDESGTTDTFTVVLDAQPTSDVVLTVTSDDTSEATVNSPLTFTPANWDTAQTVTVTGADDSIIDGTITSTITIAVVDITSDDNFDAVADQTVSVDTTDDDVAGFTIDELDGSIEVDESGTTDTFTVVLDAEPNSDVIVTVNLSDAGEASGNSSLTFTSANWDTPQTVTVTGVDDSIIDGTITSTITVAVDDANSDNDFDAVADQTVSVDTTDDDVAGFTVDEFEGSTEVDESGTTDTFTIVLDAQPSDNVVIAMSSSDTGEATISGTISFTPANWDTPQTVTVTGADEDIIDGDQNSTITITIVDSISDSDFSNVADQTVSVVTTDDDVAGFTIEETEGSTEVDESGTTDIFTVVLDAQPTSDVVLTITSDDTGEATVNSPLTFTPANWDTAQTVTVTGADEDIVDGTITSTITVAVDDANSDDDFDAVADQTVSVDTTDDDVAGFTVNEFEGSTEVTEAGSTDTFTVVLDAQPTSDVVLTVTSDDTSEATVNSPLTFTPVNWDTAQTVTVTGADDSIIDGTITSTITIAVVDITSDDNFDAVADQTVSVSTTDDDVAGFTIDELDGSIEVDESGTTDTFTVVLDAEPATDVVLTITSDDTGEATVPASVTFTSANWDTPQTVTVTGVDDDLVDGTITSTITVAVDDANSSDGFDNLNDQTISVDTTDDDVAGFTIDELDGSIEVDEAGSTDTFTVVLDAQPTSDVVMSVASNDTSEATTTNTLTFTPSNWDTAQTVTVTGIDDDIIDGTVTSSTVISIIDANSDDDFDSVADQTVSVDTSDDDTPGFTIEETDAATEVDESGTTDIFTVVLDAQPTSDVVLTITSDDTGEATVPASVTFTSANWDTPQTVTVTGADDDLVDGTITSTITVAVDDANSDDDFDAIADQTVSVDTLDDDTPGFTIEETDATTEVDESGSTDIFTVVLDAQPTSDVVLTITSDDTGEATVNSPLTFTPVNWDTAQTVTVTGVDDDLVDGTITSTITVAVDDANSDDDFDGLDDQTVSVDTLDDDVAGFTIEETDAATEVDESGSTDIFTVVLDAQPTSDVVLTITSDDTGEATVPASVTFTPVNWDTPQTVIVTGVDDDLVDGTITSTITIAVYDSSSDDDFDALDDQTVSVDTLDDDVAGFTIEETDAATEVDESGSTDIFTVVLDAEPTSDVVLTITSDDTGEATVPASVTFTAADWDTPQTVTVTGVDDNIIDGTVTSTITVAVDDANSDDDFDPLDDQTVSVDTLDDDVAGFTIEETDGSTEVDESGSTDIFTIVLDAQPTNDVVVLATASNDETEATVSGSITFTSENWDTPQTVTVTGVDDDLVDGDQTYDITISIVDTISDDEFDGVADQSVSSTTLDDDAPGFTIEETDAATEVDESGSTDIFTVVLDAQPTSDVVLTITSDDNGEATVPASVTFTPVNWDTPQTVTVTGVDDDLVDGTITSTITIAVDDANSDDDFDTVD